MKKLSTFTLTVVLLLLFSVSIVSDQDPANGQALWDESGCAKCHGDAGQGLWAGPLAGESTYEDGVAKPAEDWITQVRTPRKRMPSFSAEQVSDEAITDIHAYLTSLATPEGEFSPMDAGLADDAPEGQLLLASKKCAACHTTAGPLKGFKTREESPTAEAVITQLRTPFKNMPSFNEEQVSDEEATAIAEFLAAQYAADMATAATDSGEATTDSGEATTDSGEATTDSGEATTDSGEATTDSGEATTDSGEATTTETPTALPATGGTDAVNLAIIMLLSGISVLLAGFALKRFSLKV